MRTKASENSQCNNTIFKLVWSTGYDCYLRGSMLQGWLDLVSLRVSYGCHEISKLTSLDCNKIRSDGVVRKDYGNHQVIPTL